MMNSQQHITKLEAAERQLHVAIHMFFANEDELAVHTLASAAYRIIADLKGKCGGDEAADYYRTAVFYVVRDYRRGTVPSRFANDPEAMSWIRDMAEQLPISASSEYDDVEVPISPNAANRWWSTQTRAANFLKHADRDPDDQMSFDQIDNLELLMRAVSSYRDLVKKGSSLAGTILWIYASVISEEGKRLPQKYQRIVRTLEGLGVGAQRKYCSEVLNRAVRSEGTCA